MSRASKITLALSIVLTSLTVYGVHVQQKLEREVSWVKLVITLKLDIHQRSRQYDLGNVYGRAS
jgi:hypothetical protein